MLPEKKDEPILPNVHVSKRDQLSQKMAQTRGRQEMEVNQAVVDEYKQNEITQEEAKKEKKRKKDIKAGKNVDESDDNKS